MTDLDGLSRMVRDAFNVDMTVDITTTGRKTRRRRRMEIWSHLVDGRVIITGTPGRRGWYANFVASPEFTFHLKHAVRADLRATARPVTEESERRAIFARLKDVSRSRRQQQMDVEEWVRGSCLIEVEFRE